MARRLGNLIHYRCTARPGTLGSRLISCGPNGVYEAGKGDDIVVTWEDADESVAGETSSGK